MNASIEREPKLVEYLLGGLSPEERAEIEERFFMDDDLEAEVMATADDLVGAYLSGKLSADDRQRLESRFLASPRGAERFALVRDLLVLAERTTARPSTRRVLYPWMLAAAAAIVAVTTLVAPRLRSIPPRSEWATGSPLPTVSLAPPAARPQVRPLPGATPAKGPHLPRTGKPKVTDTQVVRLAAVSADPPTVILKPATRTVRLEIAVDQRSPTFAAIIRQADGAEAWRADGLTPTQAGGPLEVTVPAKVLVAGLYTLSVEGEPLRGESPSGRLRLEYSLRIERAR